ncbi:MAG: deoxyhypusine synthase family protein [Promethearchaeota archaeon]
MRKEDYLHTKIQPYDPTKITTVEDALKALQGCSFQGRNLGMVLEVLSKMVKTPNCLKVLTLSGALVPAGMEEIINQGIEHGIFDVIVTTGANLIHSIVNVFDPHPEQQGHYVGSEKVDDQDLYHHRINRIYDTFLPEDGYQHAESELLQIIKEHHTPGKDYHYTPSEFLSFLGSKLPGRSFINVAATRKVPIFCGAFSDSEFGLNLMKFRRRHDYRLILDELGDIPIYADIIKEHDQCGSIILGGGVPRNWAQQIFPYLDQMRENVDDRAYDGFNFSVRFHTATQYDGGLSGCTISESISWGKYAVDATHQSVWVDSTIGFPLVITALLQRMQKG